MQSLHQAVLCVVLLHVGLVHADIYKYVDENGHVTYSNKPSKGAKKLQLEPLNTFTPLQHSAKQPETPKDFPRVDEATQRRRDEERRRILEEELANEQSALEAARAKLKLAQETPMVYRTQSGQIRRNVTQYEENVRLAQEEVKMHEDNIKALQAELANLK